MAASDGDDVAANLSPAMLRSEMDAFLLTIGAKATPFSVSDMFAGAKHKDTWDEIVAVLQLVDAAVAIRLKIGLRAAAQKPTPRAVPTPRAALDPATANRLADLEQAGAGAHTSIFGKDASGRPLDKNGDVQVQAVSWAGMLDGTQTGVKVRRGVAVSKKSGLSDAGAEKQKAKDQAESPRRCSVLYPPPPRGK